MTRYKNKIRCLKCGDTPESLTRHDYQPCKCGAVAVDGGLEYQRIIGNSSDWEEVNEPLDGLEKERIKKKFPPMSRKEYLKYLQVLFEGNVITNEDYKRRLAA